MANIEYPTRNIEVATHWIFDIPCSIFDICRCSYDVIVLAAPAPSPHAAWFSYKIDTIAQQNADRSLQLAGVSKDLSGRADSMKDFMKELIFLIEGVSFNNSGNGKKKNPTEKSPHPKIMLDDSASENVYKNGKTI